MTAVVDAAPPKAAKPIPVLHGQLPMQASAVSLYEGAGGWRIAARTLGMEQIVGVEIDEDAVRTSHAADFACYHADVAEMVPLLIGMVGAGLIASPPCQTFSSAGKGAGRELIELLVALVRDWGNLELTKRQRELVLAHDLGDVVVDERSKHVLEMQRWIDDLQPEWIAFEQVQAVLPIWEAYADVLRGRGYSVWTGFLQAEQYGVPQTRKRAILIASRKKEVSRPEATHQRFVSPRGQSSDGLLFELGHRTHPDDQHLPRWISMGQAFRAADCMPEIDEPEWRTERGAGMIERAGGRRNHPLDEPAPTITGKARSATFVSNGQANATRRELDEPAPTITAGHDSAERRFVYDVRQKCGKTGAPSRTRPLDEPAPTITVSGLNGRDRWIDERPATTVTTDPRIAAPGHKGGHADDPDSPRQMDGAVRVTVQQAACLQSFPPDFEFFGSRTSQHRQIGNAVPWPLALHVLAEATGLPIPKAAQEAINV